MMEREFRLLKGRLKYKLDKMTNTALVALDDQVRLMNLRGDYVWFKDQVDGILPLGIMNSYDESLIRLYARVSGMGHIVDAIIDELSLKGAGIELALPDRLRA